MNPVKDSMKLSDQHLEEFIALYKSKYGVVLDRDDAYDRASRLLRFVEIVESNSHENDN